MHKIFSKLMIGVTVVLLCFSMQSVQKVVQQAPLTHCPQEIIGEIACYISYLVGTHGLINLEDIPIIVK